MAEEIDPRRDSAERADISRSDEFRDVFAAELEDVRARRRELFPSQNDAGGLVDPPGVPTGPDLRRGLVGLALSGGGIRSATFNLGVIQALAEYGVLKHVDYLSTVSGGGYIGSCLSAILNGEANKPADVDDGDSPPSTEANPTESPEAEEEDVSDERASLRTWNASFPFFHRPGHDELSALRHLRNFSNYLAPKGWFQFIELPALLLRGIVINLSVLLPWIILSSFIAAAWRGHMIAGAASVLDFYVVTPMSLGLVALLAVLSLLAGGRSLSDRSRLRRTWTLVLLIPLALFAVESLTLLTYLVIYVFGPEVDIWAWLRTLGGALAAILPIVLAGKAAERVSGIGGKLAILVLGLLGPAVLIVIHAQFTRALVSSSRAVFDPSAGIASVTGFWLSPVPALLALAGIGLGLWNLAFYNANRTSMLSLYRDRLSKAYLFRWRPGQKQVRHADLSDRQKLSQLASHGPYHLVNTTMNLQSRDDLNLRGRDAQNFVFAKRFSGSSLTGYIPTCDLEDLDRNLDLGTAMAISAAAASPNMGMTTIGPLILLMTLLNVRLGYWLANPKAWKKLTEEQQARARNWRPGAIYLIREMLLGPNSRRHFVNLTDGGHLENTGIYELLRRECQFIIASDAEADPNHDFPSLARLIRFASIDWGIKITMELTDLAPNTDGISAKSWALGRIAYRSGRFGYLLYIKASLMGDESESIQTYKRRNPDFPHQTTGDQFFDEAQFESYRALGYEVASCLVEYLPPRRDRVSTCGELYHWAEDLEAPLRPRGHLEEELNNLQAELNDLETRFADPGVYEYSRQVYPEFDLPAPQGSTPVDYYKVFWLCIHQLNFMENVFIRLHLDKKHQREHHFNRGWMNLFRRWARSQLFVEAWTIAIGDYSVSFERFCRDVLKIDRDMELGEPEVAPVLQAEFEAMHSEMPDDLQGMLRVYNEQKKRERADDAHVRVAYAKVSSRGTSGPATITKRFPVGFVIVEESVVQFYAVSERYRGMYYLHEIFRKLKGEVKGVQLSDVEEPRRMAARHFFERLGIDTFGIDV